ncbi:MAG TPA: queuosine precursor transporter [Sphingomonadales bacterium]|nr:queuosine precursor transporter [Sphingomonadales bacterium]
MTHPREKARRYKYYDFAMAAFVGILILSNLIGAGKIGYWLGFEFGAAVLFFPLSYVLGDVLTEVYGYGRARRCVWAGFAAMIFMSFMAYVVVKIPPAEGWLGQEAYESVFGQTPRIVFASMVAFWAGEFANAYVLAKMKIWTKGRFLWTRTIGSTVVGQAADSLLFYPLAFFAVWGNDLLLTVMVTNFALKVGWEAALTPLTYKVVALLKKVEHEDYYDTDTDFTPFSVKP